MCCRRRVYYSCLHEDHDVTPPRSLLFCRNAKPSESSRNGRSRNSDDNSTFGSLKPCAPLETLPLTSKLDLLGGVIRSGPCEACAADTGHYSMPLPLRNGTILIGHEREDRDGLTSSNGSSAAVPDTTPEDPDPMEPQEDDVFVFDWDMDDDNGTISTPPGLTREPARKDRFSGPVNGNKASVKGSASNGTEQDFQLYDGEDEFADELEEISSKEN
ncbi:hypothetical protein K449DRAFT_438951 [Hypoxylon sp. EC38]|nr:hypothetical protein K449DRAFT_438951 [Hypoxylon sp. EC38]